MARRKSNKIEPAVMTMTFSLPVPAGQRTKFLDLSQCASMLNRRFYRQGLNWAVAGIKLLTSPQSPTSTASIQINKLQNTWVTSNAWEKSFRSWMRMNKEALEENESVRPRFLDFKIYMDKDHQHLGFEGNLLPFTAAPFGGAGSKTKLGEWESSKVVIPITSPAGVIDVGEVVEREIIAHGASYQGVSPVTGFDAVSMIEGYAASRALPYPEDPNVPFDMQDTGQGTPENWLTAIFNEGTNQDPEVLEDLRTENNVAPYPFEGAKDLDVTLPSGLPNPNFGLPFADTQYPGGANNLPGLQIHDLATVSQTTVGGTTRMKGGNFPCGLISIQTNGFDDGSTATLQIDLVPGNHRGYLCEPMTEM